MKINMDGGSFVKSTHCAILTEKIVKENQFNYTKKELVEKLRETFEIENTVLLPVDQKDKYGHTDSMVRFIDNETVLVNHYYHDDSVIKSRLKQAGLKTEFLEFKVKKHNKNNWAYLNFLQTKDLLLVPQLGTEEDEQALKQLLKFYPNYK